MYEDTTVQATKFHEICAGHRVIGQGGKCERSYHGHNYVIHFTVEGEVKENGRVMETKRFHISRIRQGKILKSTREKYTNI